MCRGTLRGPRCHYVSRRPAGSSEPQASSPALQEQEIFQSSVSRVSPTSCLPPTELVDAAVSRWLTVWTVLHHLAPWEPRSEITGTVLYIMRTGRYWLRRGWTDRCSVAVRPVSRGFMSADGIRHRSAEFVDPCYTPRGLERHGRAVREELTSMRWTLFHRRRAGLRLGCVSAVSAHLGVHHSTQRPLPRVLAPKYTASTFPRPSNHWYLVHALRHASRLAFFGLCTPPASVK